MDFPTARCRRLFVKCARERDNMKYRGYQYRAATELGTQIDDAYWRHRALRFWIYAVVEAKTDAGMPAKSKVLRADTWQKVPELVRLGVGDAADIKQQILNACAAGICRYIELDFVGWEPGVPGGDRDVKAVQDTLEWIEKFRTNLYVKGARLLWAEIGSQTKQR
jgi:hypothetical protein